MSLCSPSGIMTPTTLSAPRASTQRAAATLESLPPEIPITAYALGTLEAKYSLIQFIILSFVFEGSLNIRYS